MSSDDTSSPSENNSPSTSNSYEIGYKKPPKNNRFKKGQSGNPKGREKSSRNFAILFIEAMDENIVVTENGKERSITMREAIVRRTVIDAVKGNARARQKIFEIFGYQFTKENFEKPEKKITDNDLDKLSEEELDQFINILEKLGVR